MPTTVTVRVDGLRELGEKMRGLSEKMNKSIATSATGAAAKVIKTKTVRNIEVNTSTDKAHPGSAVDTGSLRDSVIVKKIPKGQTDLTSEHIVTFRGRGKPRTNKKGVKQAQAPHAGLVEFGTVHMAAEPSLRPAFDTDAGKAQDAMVDRLSKRLNEAVR